MFSRFIIVLLAAMFVGYHALPFGAPEEACVDIRPLHNDTAQDGPAPYTLTAARDGNAITFTLEADNGAFRGFLIQAQDADGSPVTGFGAQDDEDVQDRPCPGEDDEDASAVTHTDNEDKTSIVAVFDSENADSVAQAQYAVVTDFDVFYVDLFVDVD